MFHDRLLTASELVALSTEDRLSYIRQRVGLQQYNEDHLVPGEYQPQEMPADQFPVHLYLTEEELSLLINVLDQKKRHAASMIEKCYDLPTINGPSRRTIEKHKIVINTIDDIIRKIVDQ